MIPSFDKQFTINPHRLHFTVAVLENVAPAWPRHLSVICTGRFEPTVPLEASVRSHHLPDERQGLSKMVAVSLPNRANVFKECVIWCQLGVINEMLATGHVTSQRCARTISMESCPHNCQVYQRSSGAADDHRFCYKQSRMSMHQLSRCDVLQ